MTRFGKYKYGLILAGFALIGGLALFIFGLSKVSALENPLNLTTWNTDSYILLNWDAASDEELGQFNIYRIDQNNYRKKLNQEPYELTNLADSKPLRQKVTYQVYLIKDGRETRKSEVEVSWRGGSTMSLQASNHEFYRHDLITQCKFEAKWTMSEGNIQGFLAAKGDFLENYYNGGKKASRIIYEAAQANNINPEVILVTLQKEQSLVTSSSPSQQALDRAMGYHISNPDALGFKRQIELATARYRQYLTDLDNNGYTVSGWAVGQWKNSLDPLAVKPDNKATAALYTYTPWVGQGGGGRKYVGGNYLFWDIFTRWFSVNCRHPAGTYIKVIGQNTIYKVNNNMTITPFNSAYTFLSYRPHYFVNISSTEINGYQPSGQLMPLADGSLVSPPENYNLYLIENGQKRQFKNRASFDRLGFRVSQIKTVPSGIINLSPNGAQINEASLHPDGTVIKDARQPTIWLIDNGGKRYGYQSPGVFASAQHASEVVVVNGAWVNNYAYGGLALPGNSALVKYASEPAIYMVNQEGKRGFSNYPVFRDLDYIGKPVYYIPAGTINTLSNGPNITGND